MAAMSRASTSAVRRAKAFLEPSGLCLGQQLVLGVVCGWATYRIRVLILTVSMS